MSLMKKRKLYKTIFILLIILLLILIFFASTLGVAKIPFIQSVKIITSSLPGIGRYINIEGIKETYFTIVLKIRLPRILLATLIGMALSGSGVVFQGIFKNPMADPYVLGVSSGAAFGATIAIVLGLEATFLGIGALNIMAFSGALLTTIIVYSLSRVNNKTPVVTLLLAGVALNFFLSSLISLMMTLNRNEVEKILFWTMGSVASASWRHVIITLPFVFLGSLFIYYFSRDLNIMMMGEESAKSLGVEVETIKKILLIIASMVAASSVAVGGIVGFVGLIIPHMIRLLVGPDHRVLIPFSLIAGGGFVIIADTIARVLIPPTEIPLGVITSLCGAPYFMYLLYKNKNKAFKG